MSARAALLGSIVLGSAIAFFAAPPAAQALDGVVASIKPVHSLVSAVMEGIAEPELIVRGTGSEHAHALRPSDAAALEGATVIFWVGPEMEAFLTHPIETLAGGATVVAMKDTPGLSLLEQREGGPFEAHDHDDDEAHDDGHEHEDHHDHAHAEHDLHFWLDPVNAKAMLGTIADTLGKADPENAARYAENANSYAGRLDALTGEIARELAPVKHKPIIVFHDAYQYFEHRFGINVVGSITVNPEAMPGAQRVSEIKARVRDLGAACVFAEPQFEPRLVSVVTEGTSARHGTLDPLGAEIADGPNLYTDLLRNLATSLLMCLSDEG